MCSGSPKGRCNADELRKGLKDDPAMILREIALAAERDEDIDGEIFEVMRESAGELDRLSAHEIRELFEAVLTAEKPARGLRLASAAGVMPFVLGEACYPPRSRHEIDAFRTLMEHFDRVRPEAEYRWPLLFLCFDRKKAETAIARLRFDADRHFKFMSALKKTQELYFIVNPQDFKKFLYLNGWENVAKQQRKVYDHPENRILSRYYMIKEFKEYRMAIWPEDLAVDRADLLEAGIPEKKTDYILEKLLYMVHGKPRLNTKKDLLSAAKRFARNPFSKYLRDVHFYR